MNTVNEIQWEHVLTDDEKARINPLRRILKIFICAGILTALTAFSILNSVQPLRKITDTISFLDIIWLIVAAILFLMGIIRLIQYYFLPSYLKKVPDKIVSHFHMDDDGFILQIENEILAKCFYSQINKIQVNSSYIQLDFRNAPSRAFLEILKQKMDTAPEVEIKIKKKLSSIQKISLAFAFLTVCVFILFATTLVNSKNGKTSWTQTITIYIMETYAKYGSAQDKCNVGYYYDSGTILPQNYAKAAAWYRKAADLGYSYAQSNLAGLYHKGLGVEQDDKKAFAWSMKAARQGNEYAELQLAYAYLEGKGTKPDVIKAYAWLNLELLNKKSTPKLYSVALKAQASMKKIMTEEEIAEAEALSKTLVTHPKTQENI